MSKHKKSNKPEAHKSALHSEDLPFEEGEPLSEAGTEKPNALLSALKAENEKLKQQIVADEETVATSKDSVLRAHAEMENIRRRAQKDVENAYKYSLEKFANALLPVLDSMEKAVEVAENSNDEAMAEGINLTMKMMIDTLKKFGVDQINPHGAFFDPNHHEAMAMQPHPELEDNQVMNVIQKGYLLNNRVVRPARVIIVKN